MSSIFFGTKIMVACGLYLFGNGFPVPPHYNQYVLFFPNLSCPLWSCVTPAHRKKITILVESKFCTEKNRERKSFREYRSFIREGSY